MKFKRIACLALSFSLLGAVLPILPAQKTAVAETKASVETRSITDDAGRTVEIPVTINRIAPSGGVATMILYTVARDKLVAVSKSFSEKQLPYLSDVVKDLPEIGQFYGKSSTLNMEELIASKPDVIIDLGQKKKTIVEDMDSIQEKTGIPTLFFVSETKDLPETYKKLGDLLQEEEQGEKLSKYVSETLELAEHNRAEIEKSGMKRVYWAMGDAGLNTNAKGGFQSEILDLVGVDNVVTSEPVNRGGGTEVSAEDLVSWKPDTLLVEGKQLLETLQSNGAWKDLLDSAETYLVPNGPYGFLSSPPSVNRLIGIHWLGSTLYPEIYTEDLREEVKKFYDLFYGKTPTDEQLDKLLGTKTN